MPSADPVQEIGLQWFQVNQHLKRFEDIEKFRGVLGEPLIGLYVAQRRRRASLPDNATCARNVYAKAGFFARYPALITF